MFAETLEQIQSSPPKRTMYVRGILVALAVFAVFNAAGYFLFGPWRGDFDVFHIVAQRVWLGDVDQTYSFETFTKIQAEAAGRAINGLSWTYPPQFDLLFAPFGLLPAWAAYLLFMAATLAFYLMTLRAIAGESFGQILVILFPALALNISIGQNGLLTGALIGLVCINVQKRQMSGQLLAGLALGAMVIKPHLAISVGVYLLATRRWTAITAAAMVVLVSSLLCTLVFGVQIWTAWLGAIREAAGFLERGMYPLHRMISGYAALHKTGVSATGALWGQIVVACLALLAVVLAVARRVSPPFALGVSAVVSVMISPYAYDYDLPIVGIGLALLLPDLARLASARERSVIYGLVMLAGTHGLLQVTGLAQSVQNVALAALATMALLVLLLRILLRKQPTLAASAEPAEILPQPARVLK